MGNGQDLAAMFAEVSGRLLSDPSQPVTFDRVVEMARDLVPACEDCSITLRRRRGKAATVAATSGAVDQADRLQYAVGEGPCLDATVGREVCLVDDLAADGRWPRWSPEAVALGFRSVLSLRLHAGEEEIGAVNFYSGRVAAFDPDSVDLAVIYSMHAARALDQARVVSGLRLALVSRHEIGIAQGVLAMRYGVSYDEAFAVLHRYSNNHNLKLRDVAQLVMEARELPGAD